MPIVLTWYKTDPHRARVNSRLPVQSHHQQLKYLPLTIYQHNTHIAFPLQIHFVRENGLRLLVMVKSTIGGKISLEHANFRRRLPHYRFIP